MNRLIGIPRSRQRGVTMLEVLVTLLIVTLGLLGTAGMQGRLQTAQIEAYQRAQGIVVLQDMVDRINANRKNAASYATAAALGTGDSPAADCTALTTQAARDQCSWSKILLGASETSGGASVGAMIGARGCVEVTAATMPRELKVSVVWQGLSQTRAPTGTTCGSGSYGDELMRRAMVTYVKIGCLQNDVTTGLCVTP